MGEITVEQIMSADGYAADHDGGLGFFDDVDFGDESRTDTEQMRWLAGVDAVLLGRRTYELFAGYWPDADPAVDAVAVHMARLPKYVVSRTLESAPWGDGEVEVLRSDPASAARTVAERHGHVAVWGSLTVADELFRAGLVDRLRVRVVPLLLGSGRPVAPADIPLIRLELVASQRDPHGMVLNEYRVLRGR